MRPGEFSFRVGNQTREFLFDFENRYKLNEELKSSSPLAYLINGGAIENFVAKALFYILQGKRQKSFNLRNVFKWLDEPIHNRDGAEIDFEEAALEILYAHARSLTGKQAAQAVKELDQWFENVEREGDKEGEDEEGNFSEG